MARAVVLIDVGLMSNRVPRVPLVPRQFRRPAAQTPSKVIPSVGGSKIGPVAAPNPNVATAQAPAADQGRAEARTVVQTYFTKADAETTILYNGDRQWSKITLTLETAGPVAVGTVQKITPVLSGKGIQLSTDEPTTITVAKGTRLYIASTSVNRVRMQVEPLPWLEQITGLLRQFVGGLAARLRK